MNDTRNGTMSVFIRLFGYLVLIGAAIEFVVHLQQKRVGYTRLFDEGSLLENLQVVALAGSFVVLVLAALRHRLQRELFGLMALLPVIAMVRELDSRFDNWFGNGVWGTVVVLVTALGAWQFYARRSRVIPQMRTIVEQRCFGYMAGAMIVILTVAQLIGQKAFWRAYMGEHYVREVPRAVEEFGELAGYLLLLCGVIELYFSSPKEEPRQQISVAG